MNGLVYKYDENSGEYLGEYQSQQSPLEPGKWLDDIPNTLKIAPPATGQNEAACAVDGAWVIKSDYRGTWYKPDGSMMEITELDVLPEQDWTIEPPQETLPQAIARSLASIDADTDAIYQDAIGNRGPEYTEAEAAANAYKDAGYTGDVPSAVQSWATAKGWTAQQAADDILAAAAQLNTAKLAIRAERLLRKEQVRAAADAGAVDAAMVQWAGFVAAIRVQLGL
jgi:hypothetical protein